MELLLLVFIKGFVLFYFSETMQSACGTLSADTKKNLVSFAERKRKA